MNETPVSTEQKPVFEVIKMPKPRSMASRMFRLKVRQFFCWHRFVSSKFRVATSDPNRNEATTVKTCQKCNALRVRTERDTTDCIHVGKRNLVS